MGNPPRTKKPQGNTGHTDDGPPRGPKSLRDEDRSVKNRVRPGDADSSRTGEAEDEARSRPAGRDASDAEKKDRSTASAQPDRRDGRANQKPAGR